MNSYITVDSDELRLLCDKVLQNISTNLQVKKQKYINHCIQRDKKGWFGKVKVVDEDDLTDKYSKEWERENGWVLYGNLKSDMVDLKAACNYSDTVNVDVSTMEKIDRWVKP